MVAYRGEVTQEATDRAPVLEAGRGEQMSFFAELGLPGHDLRTQELAGH